MNNTTVMSPELTIFVFLIGTAIAVWFLTLAANYTPLDLESEPKQEEPKPAPKEGFRPVSAYVITEPVKETPVPDWVQAQEKPKEDEEERKKKAIATSTQWIDNIFRKRDEHIAIVGASGDGKTTLVKAFFTKAVEHGYQIVLIDPHNLASAWGIETCLTGFNYDQAIQAIEFVYAEFVKRANTTKEEYPWQKLVVCIDEWPSIQKKCPALKDKVVEMVLQARKFDIRIMLITQSINVKDMGLEGSGPVRESFIRVILRSFSVAILKEKNKQIKGAWPVALNINNQIESESAKDVVAITRPLKQSDHWQPVLDNKKEFEAAKEEKA